MLHRATWSALLGLALTLFLGGATPAHAEAAWDRVDPGDLALSGPTVEPDAGAEVLLWRITVEDALGAGYVFSDITQQFRIKVFDAKGAEAAGTVELLYDRGVKILDFAARTVRPDGSVVEVPKRERFERTVVKASGVRRKAISFAFPSVTPGAVLEYRWTERRYDDLSAVTLMLQRDLPVRMRELRLKPLKIGALDYQFRMRCFGMTAPVFETDAQGFRRALLPPIRARSVEPYMPPEFQSVPWAVLYYTMTEDPSPEALWEEFAEQWADRTSGRIRGDKTVERQAAAIAAGAADDEERAFRLAAWCRGTLDNWDDDRLDAPNRNQDDLPVNKRPSDTLKRMGGRADDLTYLFIAMCQSLGLKARLALTADRSQVFFSSKRGVKGFLDNKIAAVWIDGRWRFFELGLRWLQDDALAWWEDGQEGLIVDKKEAAFVQIPMAPPDSALLVRTARLAIREDGSAEGEVRLEFHGREAANERAILDGLTAKEQIDHLRDVHLPTWSGLTIGEARFDSLGDAAVPLAAACTVRVPGYASAVGSRRLLSPSFFTGGASPTFPSEQRRLPVYFSYPWSVRDTVMVEWPQGLVAEETPQFRPVDVKGVGAYRAMCLGSMDGRSARYIRTFHFGKGETIYFPVSEYRALKKVFDDIYEQDRATLSLRESAAADPPGDSGAPSR